jgi:hypothetical protein
MLSVIVDSGPMRLYTFMNTLTTLSLCEPSLNVDIRHIADISKTSTIVFTYPSYPVDEMHT